MGGGSAPSATRSALADAAAGVVGSLVSMLAFYPVDVYKTNLQAGRQGCDGDSGSSSITGGRRKRNKDQNADQDGAKNTILYLLQFLRSSFRGVQYKTAHTISGSFAYFFFYSWMTARHRTYVTGGTKDDKYSPSTSARLLLAAVAAMMNTTLTLPLDVISARKQTGQEEHDDEDKEGDAVASDDESSNEKNAPQSAANIMNHAWDEADNAEERNDEEKKGDEIHSALQQKTSERMCSPSPMRQPGTLSTISKFDLKSISSLWSGLVPSLLLCTNPSIHFTVFDTLKSSLLQRKYSRSKGGAKGDEMRLSMAESFLIGLLAKFAATIATYPLIRAKVMLMCNSKGTPAPKEEKSDGDRYNFRRGDTTLNFGGRVYDKNPESGTEKIDCKETRTRPNLWGVLCSIYKDEGVPGLYRGCNLQLIHTLLKSALLMMVRERIIVTTRSMILSSDKKSYM